MFSYSGLGYADVVGMLTPSVWAMQALLHICEDFAKEFNIVFNTRKFMCMQIGNKGDPPLRAATLHGSQLPWKWSVRFLGTVISCDLNDSEYIRKESLYHRSTCSIAKYHI